VAHEPQRLVRQPTFVTYRSLAVPMQSLFLIEGSCVHGECNVKKNIVEI